MIYVIPLQWRHNEHGGVSNHSRLDGWLNRLLRHRSKKTWKPRVTGICEGNSPVVGEFPAQRASTAENVSIWWRHQWSCLSEPAVAYVTLFSRNQITLMKCHGGISNKICTWFSLWLDHQLLGLLLLHELTLIHAWKIIPCPIKCGMKLFFHSQASTVVSLKFGNG